MEAGARGIGHGDVGAHSLAYEVRQHVTHLATEERRVRDPVRPGVPGRVSHGSRDQLDAVHPPRLSREQEADRSRAAVEIDDRLGAGETGRVPHDLEEPLGLDGVRLEERAGRDLERDPVQ